MGDQTKNFQGIRILFLLGIAFMHAQMPIFGQGNLLCTFFFILSGFLYKQPSSVKDYYIKKIVKIYPFYWICIGLYYSLLTRPIDWNIIPHILLLQSFVPSSSTEIYYFKYIGVSWFLCSLLFCYAVSPFVYPLLKKIKGNANIVVIGIVILAMILLRASKLVPQDYRSWFFYISPFWRLLEYMLGIMLKSALEETKERQELMFPNLCGLTVLGLYLFALNQQVSPLYVSIIHLFVIFFLYTYKSAILDFILGNKYVVNLAKYGLNMYLSHQFIYFYLYKKIEIPKFWSIVVAVVIGFLLGWLYAKIEAYIKSFFQKHAESN
ncbi:MAG: acyltransferase family protein [Bacteroidales bacterium]|nr:acyltransferase family protein [Bacteroidales bacterium]